MRYSILTLLCLLVYGCTSTTYVPVETVKTDSVYISLFERDSIYIHDSVYVREKNDTIFVDKVKYRYKEKTVRDTIVSEKVDTIRVPYPVEKKLSKWETTYLAVGRIVFWVVIVTIIVVVGSLIYRLIK